jgi:beta-galactosidase/beta-glucuronidase
VREEPPLPLERRARRLSLNGVWQVELEPGARPRPIVVPFPFEAPLSGIGLGGELHERLRYRRDFEVPEEWRGSRVLLRFGAVDWSAEVSVDGEHLGGHRGGYTHFALDLGRLPPGRHEVVVGVEDPAEGPQPRGKQRSGGGIWYTRTTGIWQPVWLEPVPDDYIRSFSVEPSPDGRVRVRAATAADTELELRLAGRTVRFADEVEVEVERPRLWSPEEPVLYDLELRTAGGDAVSSYTAFRTIEARGGEILLNGRPRRLRGVLDQGFWPDGIYTAPTDAAIRADVEAAKALGFDLARMHVKVADPRWYWWCDRVGLLVLQDIPSSHDLSTDAARAGFAAEADAIAAQLRGHPSVVCFVAINEDWGGPTSAFQAELVERLRAVAPGRLVVDASGWHRRGGSDLDDVHDYGDDLTRHRGDGRTPCWIGECGGISLPVPGHTWESDHAYRTVADADELASAYARLVGGIDASVAGFVWTQLTDVEGELNGLLTYDRLAKVPPERIRAVNERLAPTSS